MNETQIHPHDHFFLALIILTLYFTLDAKLGRPEEIAHAIYFLADNEQSSFMTGQAMVVDGGATARLNTG